MMKYRTALAAALLIALTTLPVLFLRTPPFIDVLGHMGRYALQTGLDRQPFLQQFYSFDWQVIGNLGADVVVEIVQPVLGVAGATRLAIALVPLLAASGIMLLSRQVHGRITPFAIGALTLVYSLPFTWGFLNFSLSMAAALLALTLWLHLGQRRARIIVFVPLILAIWLCHTFGWAFLGILCTADSLANGWQAGWTWRRTLLETVRRGWPLLAPLAPMLLWRGDAAGFGIDGWFDWNQKATWLMSTLRLTDEWPDKLCAAALLAAIVLGFNSRKVGADRRMAIAASIAAIAFLLLPKQIFGSVFADMRLAPYVLILALLALDDAQLRGQSRSALLLLALGFFAVRLTLTAYGYHQRERILEQHLTALSAIPEHARVATLVEMPCQSEWALPWFSHIGSMAIVQRNAFANDQWANASMNPLQVHFPAAGAFATDDRQLFFPARCGMAPGLPQALRALPVHAFTHIWIIGVRPAAIPPRAGLTLAWRSDDAAVFTVDHPISLRSQRISKLSKLQP
jgi:hypothetical protein